MNGLKGIYRQISEVSCEHFQDLFTVQANTIDEEPFNSVPKMVTLGPKSRDMWFFL